MYKTLPTVEVEPKGEGGSVKARVMKWLWFPQSVWLAQHWWHRLATVVFWTWSVFWLFLLWVVQLESAWWSCRYTNHENPDVFCGSNPWSGLLYGVQVNAIAFIAATVAGLFLPAVLYRTTLFVATGDKWKD